MSIIITRRGFLRCGGIVETLALAVDTRWAPDGISVVIVLDSS